MVTRTPSSGQISMSDVNLALTGKNATDKVSLNDTAVRSLAGAGYTTTNSTISMSVLHGKISLISGSTSTNIQNLNIYNELIKIGWDGAAPAAYTINAGVYIWSDSTSIAALVTGGPFPGGLTIINNGYIMGKGGTGAGQGYTTSNNVITSQFDAAATAGGTAISVQIGNLTITNNGYIAGGGGGGGRAGSYSNSAGYTGTAGGGGGGAGGGAGGNGTVFFYGPNPSAGGAGGVLGGLGADAYQDSYLGGTGGGGGGRVLPGTGGAGQNWTDGNPAKGGGAGGGGGVGYQILTNLPGQPGYGGNGGSAGNSGDNGNSGGGASNNSGGGGGWGASGGNPSSYSYGGTSGAAGGKAVALNSYSVTWTATGIRYGAIS